MGPSKDYRAYFYIKSWYTEHLITIFAQIKGANAGAKVLNNHGTLYKILLPLDRELNIDE